MKAVLSWMSARRKLWDIVPRNLLLVQMLMIFVLEMLFIAAQSKEKKTQPIEVTIHSGAIRGELLSLGADEYTVFKGIPYAAPPVGALRFQKPIEPASWRGVMNATQFSMACRQLKRQDFDTGELGAFYSIRRSEDCLYLNVFSFPPYTNDTFPVIFFIHGGGFQIGSASDYKQEPILQNFVSRKTVFVTLNYRLGPLGFASTGDKLLPGNNGLWDIILALEWVKKNIKVFGGDKNRVTLMGHGSGAAAASILALSPRTEGLYHRLILLSGTAITPGVVRNTAINATDALQKALRCRAMNSTQLLKCFYTRSSNELLRKPKVFYDDYQDWVPLIDHYGGVIPEAPEILAEYRPKVPMLLGTTRDESALYLLYFDKKQVNFSAITKRDAEWLVKNLTSVYSGFTNHKLITEGCNYEYVLTKTDPGMDILVLKNGILDMYSHFWFHAPASRLADYYAADGAPVYLYSFDHVSENLFTEESEWKGSFHGSDLIFLFDIKMDFLDTRRDQNWQIDRRVTEIFTELLTNFAGNGDPTPPEAFLPFNWTKYDRKEVNYLSITDSPKMNVGFHWRGHVFWNTYALRLDAVDVGNLGLIADLRNELGDYQLATWVLLSAALFFFAILVSLACYCTRKDSEEDDM